MKADTICGWPRAARFPRVGRLLPSRNAPTTTMNVGTSRKIVVYVKKGTTPSRAPTGLRPTDALILARSANGLGPVGRQVGVGLVVLRLGQEHRCSDRLGQCGIGGLVDRACCEHRCCAHGSGGALEPQVLALVGVEVLLPKTGSGRVRSVLADRLHVVTADHGPSRDNCLPCL